MCWSVPSNCTPIVTQLFSRSITEGHLGVRVHQHFRQKQHLLWSVTNRGISSQRCIQRTFLTYEDSVAFCKELVTGELEGLCNCTHEDINLYIEQEKIDKCYQLIPVPREYNNEEYCFPFTSVPAVNYNGLGFG